MPERLVLALDDDPLYLDILVEQLHAVGVHDVLAHTRAEDVMAALAQRPVDLIISDLDMPEVDGPRFLHRLADVGSRAQVVLISGTRPDLLASVLEFGRTLGLRMLGALRKPAELEDLAALLRRCEPSGPAWAPTQTDSLSDGEALGREQLEQALLSGAIRPWYQAKLDAQSLRVLGVEALARWLPPSGPAISPARFVPEMEAHGLSWALFLCIYSQVLQDLARWHAQG